MLPLQLRVRVACLTGILLAIATSCAPKQRIPIEVLPSSATLYLDGEELDSCPTELDLRSDEDHKLYFKSEGYRPALVVLISSRAEGKPRLDPPVVRVRLVPRAPRGREVEIQEEENPSEIR